MSNEALFDKVIACLKAPRGKPFTDEESIDAWKSVLAVAEIHKRGRLVPPSGSRDSGLREGTKVV
jgi:hypothetical protein